MPDANYAVTGTANSSVSTRSAMLSPYFGGTYSTTQVRVFINDSANAMVDSTIAGLAVFR